MRPRSSLFTLHSSFFIRLLAFLLLLLGFLLVFLTVIRVINASIPLLLVAYAASLAGLCLGIMRMKNAE
jgi:hypothetical protein